MSRIVNLRSPFVVKVESSAETRILESATLFLYVWKGSLGERPTVPSYTLSQERNVVDNFIVFEIAELARDFIDQTFDGINRVTDPVYIGYEVVKNYETNNNTDRESGLVIGMDGYEAYGSGLQGHFNYIQNLNHSDEDLDIEIFVNVPSADREALALGQRVRLYASFNPSDATVTWYRDGVELGDGWEYPIDSWAATDNGIYTAKLTPPEGDDRVPIYSNEIKLTLPVQGREPTISPTFHRFGQASGDAQVFLLKYDATDATISATDITKPDWLDTTIGTTSTSGNFKTTRVTFTTNAANDSYEDRAQAVITFEAGVENAMPKAGSLVTQAGDVSDAPSGTLSAGDTSVFIGSDVTVQVTGIDDPAGDATDVTFQWVVDGQDIVGATGTVPASGNISRVFNYPTYGERLVSVKLTSSVSGRTGFAETSGDAQAVAVTWYTKPLLQRGSGQLLMQRIGQNITYTPTFYDPAGGDATNWQWTVQDADGNTVTPVSGGGTGDNFVEVTSIVVGGITITVTADSSVSGQTSEELNDTLSFGNVSSGADLTGRYFTSISSAGPWVQSTGTEESSNWIRCQLEVELPDDVIVSETQVVWRLDSVTGPIITQADLFREAVEIGSEDDVYLVNLDRFSAAARSETIFAVVEDKIYGNTVSQEFNIEWTAPKVLFIAGDDAVEFDENAHPNQVGTVRSNYTWGASVNYADSTDTGWITFDDSTGGVIGSQYHGDTFQYDVAENTSGCTRMATIYVRTGNDTDDAVDTLNVIQSGTDKDGVHTFQVAPLALPSDGGNVGIVVDAEPCSPWKIEVKALGFYTRTLYGTGDDDIDINIPAWDSTTEDREISFTITALAGGSTPIDNVRYVRQVASQGNQIF